MSCVAGARRVGRDVAHADPLVEHRRVRAGRHLATAGDRHALARDRLLLHHEGDELPLRPGLLDLAQPVGAGEVLAERARPTEAGRDRIRVLRDVVAVQRVADLQAQRVARTEPAGDGAAGDDRVPERDRVLGRAHQLDTLLARVAGAVDHHLDPVHLAHRVRERLRLGKAQALDRPRALDGEQRVLVGGVAHLGAADLVLLHPRVGRVAVARVDDDEIVVRVDPVGDQVVDDPAVLVREQRVLRLAVADLVEVVRQQ